jgi:hypothetical protein
MQSLHQYFGFLKLVPGEFLGFEKMSVNALQSWFFEL